MRSRIATPAPPRSPPSINAPPCTVCLAPRSRAGGVCGTCVSKLVSGQVDNEWLDVLDDGNVLSKEQVGKNLYLGGWVGFGGTTDRALGGRTGVRHRLLHTACACTPLPPAQPTDPLCNPPNCAQVAAGYILPCSAKPLSDCVVEVK